jgi:hypothetical protein
MMGKSDGSKSNQLSFATRFVSGCVSQRRGEIGTIGNAEISAQFLHASSSDAALRTAA